MSEIGQLRMELKADMELLAIHHGQSAQKVEEMSGRLEEQGQQIREQGQQIREQGQQIREQGQRILEQGQRIYKAAVAIDQMSERIQQTSLLAAGLGRKVAEDSRWAQGRFRLLNERFENVLGAVEREVTEDRSLLHDLCDRVARLEQDRPPAA